MNTLYQKLAEALGTEIEETFEAEELTDAGAVFRNGYDLQIAPYATKKYILTHFDGVETFTEVGHFENQKNLLEFAATLKV